jgi:thiosulfate/3-mercaptopyruvate sulfurtransferase
MLAENACGGHIPGAVSLPSSGNLDPNEWTFLESEALRERAHQAGINPDQRVILYCGVGISASLGMFALHWPVFRNWPCTMPPGKNGHDPDLPVEQE